MKFHIITYGCQMNKSDSERIAGLLRELGWEEASGAETADLIILNTCSVRQSAENRVFGEVNNLVELKKTNPRLVVAITGCMPGRDKNNQMRKKLPGADLFFPIIDVIHLPEMLQALGVVLPQKNLPQDYLDFAPQYTNNFQAFIPIQTGCNNFCTYCVVPYSRGRERNRSVKSIVEEVKKLAEKGYLEITLLGQTINNYQAPDPENFSSLNPFKNHFAALLWELNQIEGIKWIHYTAADPQYMSDEVIATLILPKQVNYLHLPVQAGSNAVLAKMNRKYTRENYLEIITKIKKTRPGIALGTDIIVGFPGETAEDFTQTADLFRQADFDISYNAKYSPRSGTPAFKMADDVLLEEKERRWWVLQNLMEEIVLRKNQIFSNQEIEVLVEKCNNGLCSGHNNEMKFVQLNGDETLVGKIVKMKVDEAGMWVLRGKLVI
ncbi:MAG: tRNA (N6-isopentenyl adenosine(37)-C2)-methylthiotransferase MiaB [Candidatus Magasanikbacteria bacterium]|nr:tRNA (N6-isopentenyl adenosine(37)-C2)-methylthiotransferase MiaB [Candidatus Magasanikbacteria bacterium]